jgi:hypothetical protein
MLYSSLRKNGILSLFLLMILSMSLFGEKHKRPTSITYTRSGGRLGDNLIAYMHAKWLAYVHDLPFLYVPFEYSDQLPLHEVEERYYKGIESEFDAVIQVKNENTIDLSDTRSILYRVDYFTESRWEGKVL